MHRDVVVVRNYFPSSRGSGEQTRPKSRASMASFENIGTAKPLNRTICRKYPSKRSAYEYKYIMRHLARAYTHRRARGPTKLWRITVVYVCFWKSISASRSLPHLLPHTPVSRCGRKTCETYWRLCVSQTSKAYKQPRQDVRCLKVDARGNAEFTRASSRSDKYRSFSPLVLRTGGEGGVYVLQNTVYADKAKQTRKRGEREIKRCRRESNGGWISPSAQGTRSNAP